MNYENMKIAEYQRNKYLFYNKYLHVYFGMQQLRQRPYLNIFSFFLCVSCSGMWIIKDYVLTEQYIPKELYPFMQFVTSVLLIVMFLLSAIALFEELGRRIAIKDEGGLAYAFVNRNIRGQSPILFSKKLIKGTKVTVREFYSEIPLHYWENIRKDIEDNMNITLVEPYITYGGKNKDTSKRIIMYSLQGKTGRNQKVLQDEIF